LETLITKELLDDNENNGLSVSEPSLERVNSMLFSVPISQIATNNMTVKLSIGNAEIVHINCNAKTFAISGFGSSSFLLVLEGFKAFTNISLKNMINPTNRYSTEKIIILAPGLKLQTEVQKLEFQNIPLDLEEGKIFKDIMNEDETLTNHYYLTHSDSEEGDIAKVPRLRVKELIPLKSIKVIKLTGFYVDTKDVRYESEEWELDELHLIKCYLPSDLSDTLESKWLDVRQELWISHCPSPAIFQPNSKLLFGIICCGLTKAIQLHPFDFNISGADEKIKKFFVTCLSKIVPRSSKDGIQRNLEDEVGTYSFDLWNPDDVVTMMYNA